MSIEKEGVTTYTPTCDICFETLPSERNFQDAVDVKKEARWKSRYDNHRGCWEDICNECQ